MSSFEPEEQLRILARVSEEIIPEEEFLEKVRRSAREGRPLRVKYGMDPTAPDLHLGNAIALHKLRTFQELGHLPVIIVGDYTARVGDPSEANKTRPMLTEEEVEANAQTYLDQVGLIVDLDGAEIRRNGEWFAPMTFAEVVRLTARATVARMIERDDFSLRLSDGVPIGVHELLYPIMQAWDSVMVKADVEIGGTDQKFNLLFAREFQRAEGQEPQIVMTHPLIEGLDGVKKMSKSLDNYIGVTEAPREIFGKTMSLPDALMAKFFRLTTDVPDERIASLLDPDVTHPRDAKEALGKAIVARYHSEVVAEESAAEFRRIFSDGKLPDEMPEVRVPAAEVEDGRVWIVKLVTLAGFASSGSEARRLVAQGGVSIDGEKVEDVDAKVELAGGETLRVGKRRFGRVVMG
ncbi:MAG: tyrosine--tRNA ligase [Planctomycetota bacterium]|jgi:tyrosyl-tRNA synthetase